MPRTLLAVLAAWLMCCATVAASAAPPTGTVTASERVKRNVVVRQQPSTRSAALAALAPGDKAILRDVLSGWYEVALPDGTVGFVSKTWTNLAESGPLVPVAAAEPLRMHVIDVGTGLAVFVEGPGFTMLYDGGSQDDLAAGPDNRILAYIASVRPGLTEIDHLVLSHPHKDHLELLPDVFDRYVVRNVWDSGVVNETRGYCRFLKKVETEAGVIYHDAIGTGGAHAVTFSGSSCSGTITIREGERMSALPVALGVGATMTVLYRDASHHADPNGNSVVVRIDFGGRRILLVGDAEAGDRDPPTVAPKANSIEGLLLACCRADLMADVLVVGHHGSLTSSRRAFLDAVGASTFIISSGPHPYSGVQLPDAAVIAELSTRGAVFRTDIGDTACARDPAKVGNDADESPGGCSNVVVSVAPTAELATTYSKTPD